MSAAVDEKSSSSLIDQALTALSASAGIGGACRKMGDASPVIELSQEGLTARFAPLVKTTMRPAYLELVREQMARSAGELPLLLITHHVSAPLVDQLRALGIPFLDAAGNAYLRTKGWFVLITGRAAPEPVATRARLSATTWQVAYVLLQDPATWGIPLRDLGARAGVSLSSTAQAIKALAERGWLRDLGRRGRPVHDPDGLRQTWEFGYLDQLAGKLQIGRARTLGVPNLQAWAQAVEGRFGPERGLLGGELAADWMGLEIHASTAALHVPRWDGDAMRAFRLIPAKDGPISIFRTFGTSNAAPRDSYLADPLLVRAELATLRDDRLQGTRAALLDLIRARWEKP